MFATVRTRIRAESNCSAAPTVTIGAFGAGKFHCLVVNSVGVIQIQQKKLWDPLTEKGEPPPPEQEKRRGDRRTVAKQGLYCPPQIPAGFLRIPEDS